MPSRFAPRRSALLRSASLRLAWERFAPRKLDTVSYEEYDLWEEIEDSVIIHYFLERCNIAKILKLFRLDLKKISKSGQRNIGEKA